MPALPGLPEVQLQRGSRGRPHPDLVLDRTRAGPGGTHQFPPSGQPHQQGEGCPLVPARPAQRHRQLHLHAQKRHLLQQSRFAVGGRSQGPRVLCQPSGQAGRSPPVFILHQCEPHLSRCGGLHSSGCQATGAVVYELQAGGPFLRASPKGRQPDLRHHPRGVRGRLHLRCDLSRERPGFHAHQDFEGAPEKSSTPQIISPNSRVIYELRPGADLLLTCEVDFTFLKDSPQEVWWTIDGRNTDNIVDLRFNVTHEETSLSVGKTKIEKTLFVPKVTEKDLKRNYTCFAHNNNGTVNMQALVKLKAVVPRYTVELACGLGATVLLVVILTIVYHVYWLELVLFYRAHFGTDETILDGKEYDVYISYARNVEEEEFVLLTLRGVLENEFGYKLCIFDRDSLPGGNITEAIFDFIQRSRKMIVVLSPDYLLEKSISMLEFKLGLLCQNNIATKLVVVEYRPLSRVHPNVQQLKESVPFIPWKGEKSKRPGSRFWKALRLALPLRSLNTTGLSAWNESCSSHSDVSLDHVQRKRRRLKGPAEGQQSARPKGVPVQRGAAQPPRLKARDHAKPFLACRCCVAYCNENHKLGGHSPAVGKPKQEGQLHRTLAAGDPAGRRLQSSEKLRPPGSQVSALSLRRYADASNNNDFYVL
ncbi:interleukin-1 receptor accessory protein isoform X2 [Pogona vitticeps]